MKTKSGRISIQLKKFISSLFLAILISLTFIQPAASEGTDVTFGETKVENFFPNGLRFSVKIVVQDYDGRIDFYYRLGEDEWTSYSIGCTSHTKDSVEYLSCVFYLNYEVIPPQLKITYKWRLYGQVNKYSAEKTIIYENPAYHWNSVNENNVSIWWHDHPFDLSSQILVVANTALQTQGEFYKIKLETPVQIVILNSEEELYEWRERTSQQIGGEAFPDLGSTIQIFELDMLESDQTDWINQVIPHEISHIYFFHATGKRNTGIPKWLNEGLAGYHEMTDHSIDWYYVRLAIQNKSLFPLNAIRENFPEGDENVSIAYAESTTAVIYLIETYGQESLQKLLEAYQQGKKSDDAFMQAIGQDINSFEQDWQTWVMSHPKTANNEIYIILIVFICISLACGVFGLVFVIVLIAGVNRKIKIQAIK